SCAQASVFTAPRARQTRHSHLQTLESPRSSEVVAAIFFNDLAVPDDQAFGGSLQHGVKRAGRSRLVRNLLSGVRWYAHAFVAAGQARATAPGPVVPPRAPSRRCRRPAGFASADGRARSHPKMALPAGAMPR